MVLSADEAKTVCLAERVWRSAVRNRGESDDEREQDGLRGERAMWERGPSRARTAVKTASDAQALEACRFRSACGHL